MSELLDELIAQAQGKFSSERQHRHDMGAQKYGPVKFLEPDNDLFRMLQEELVDAANYAEYLFIRLEIIRNAMEGLPQSISDAPPDTPRGAGSVVNPYGGSHAQRTNPA